MTIAYISKPPKTFRQSVLGLNQPEEKSRARSMSLNPGLAAVQILKFRMRNRSPMVYAWDDDDEALILQVI